MAFIIAACGLYYTNCKKYRSRFCSGYQKNEKASWCNVRACCMTHNYRSCADCNEYDDPKECKLFNNGFSRFIGWLVNSDRKACIVFIKENGYDRFAEEMNRQKGKSFLLR